MLQVMENFPNYSAITNVLDTFDTVMIYDYNRTINTSESVTTFPEQHLFYFYLSIKAIDH